MKTRIKLNKKGLTARELVIFILAIGVLVLMFWGPLGTWWHSLTQKYHLFEKSVDDKISELNILGLGSTSTKDLRDISSTSAGKEAIFNELKKSLINCNDVDTFETAVIKVEPVLKKLYEETYSELYRERNTNFEKIREDSNDFNRMRRQICDRSYLCFKETISTSEKYGSEEDTPRYRYYSIFAGWCGAYKDARIGDFINYIREIKEKISTLEKATKYNEAAILCGRFSKYGMLDQTSFDQCYKTNIKLNQKP